MRMLRNAHLGTAHVLKSYINQVLNGAINHYNGALSTAYTKIAALEAQVTHLQGELNRLPGRNVASKTKVLEPPTFAGSKNKMHLHDWLSQIALYCSASGITTDSQKIVCALTCLCAPASTYMKSYFDKIEARSNVLATSYKQQQRRTRRDLWRKGGKGMPLVD